MRAFDGLLETAWATADDDDNPWLELRLDSTTQVSSVSIWPGELSAGSSSFLANSRPSKITVQLITGKSEAEWPTASVELRGDGSSPQRLDLAIEGRTRKVRFKIDEVSTGSQNNRLFIAEAGVNFAAGTHPGAVESVQTWTEGASAKKASTELHEEVVSLFTALIEEPVPPAEPVAEGEDAPAIDEGEDEPIDKDLALASLLTWAGDGAPHMRARVARYVPAGYRMNALPPETKAVEALVKLRKPEAISGLEKAALRSTGRAEKRLALQVAYYYALAELQDGASAADGAWGAPGWGPGGLRSFGEVANLDVDGLGHVLVGDLANHRVQRFSDDGRGDRSWGAPPKAEDASDQITNLWLEGKRSFYVSGAPPSTKDGGFTFPLDVAILPGKTADGFAALDMKKRVQIFDGSGALLRSWVVRVEDELMSGVGGQAFLVNARGKLAVVWGSEVVVFDQEAEELARFTLERGAPAGAIGLKNGKIGLIYEQDMILYSTDGFEHGSLFGDDLPDGFESWDVDVDPEGGLWVMTDTGWVLKYKKPGKLEFKVQALDESLGYLRIAAASGKVYLLIDDHIRVIDAASLALPEGS